MSVLKRRVNATTFQHLRLDTGEKKRLGKEIKKLEKDMNIASRKLSNKDFLKKAPEDIVKDVREKMEVLTSKIGKLNENLSFFENIDD